MSLDNMAGGSRIALLEDSVAGYRRQAEAMEGELNKMSGELATARQNCRQVCGCGVCGFGVCDCHVMLHSRSIT